MKIQSGPEKRRKRAGKPFSRRTGFLLGTLAGLGLFIWLILLISARFADGGSSRMYRFPDYTDKELDVLDIKLSPRAWDRLEAVRAEALKTGILVTGDEDRVKAQLRYKGQKIPARLRLKGDWVDHLRGKKWSFRVSLKSGESWNRLVTFSLMTPEARDFLHEWVYHKLLEKADVLTPRYGFLHLRINGKSYGIYTWEEHFEKQLVEYKHRREGPLMKLSEDALWTMRQVEKENVCKFIDHKTMRNAADIQPFKLSKTLASPVLAKEFAEARELVYQYQHHTAPASDIFDIDLMGRYYAIVDLTRTYHALIWHNQRFYYNPVTGRLEPIGFDGDAGENPRYTLKAPFLGLGKPNDTRRPRNNPIVMRLFDDPALTARYRKYLELYSSEAWLAAFEQEIAAERDALEALLQREFKGYTYDRLFLRDNAAKVREALEQFPATPEEGGQTP